MALNIWTKLNGQQPVPEGRAIKWSAFNLRRDPAAQQLILTFVAAHKYLLMPAFRAVIAPGTVDDVQ